MSEWISIKERLPDNPGDYIAAICDKGCPYGEGVWYYTAVVFAEYALGDWIWRKGYQEVSLEGLVTHWMPLPEPPEEEK